MFLPPRFPWDDNCDCIPCTKGMFRYVSFVTFNFLFKIFSFGMCFFDILWFNPYVFFLGMFSHIIMPLQAYEELRHNKYAMPLPVYSEARKHRGGVDPHYVSFEEAVTHPFTDEHQPSSLQNRRRNINSNVAGDVTRSYRNRTSTSSHKQGSSVV